MNRRDRGRYIVRVKDVSRYMDRKVSLLGVVVEFTIPRKCGGTDCCTILKIMDESQQSPELCVNIFTENIDDLPHIRSHKDLILLSHVLIKPHEQQSHAVFNKSFSSFALFDAKNTDSFSPYQASPTFGLLDSDKEFIRRLRDWCLSFPFDAGISEYVVPLKDIREQERFDLVCEVLHVCEVSRDEWMLFVWDGTDAPALSLDMQLGDEEQNPLPLQIEPMPLPKNVLSKFHCVGTVLRVTADKAYENLGGHFQGVCNWVRIRNLCCKPHSGLWEGLLTPTTKFRLLSKNDKSVRERQRKCVERISEWGRVPLSRSYLSNFLTVTDYECVEFVTLMDLLTFPQDYGKFKCIVRVVAVCPSQAKDFCSPAGQYRIRMTLEDPTARIHARLCDKDAEVFFGGYPAVDVLTTKMDKLLGVPKCEDSPRNPPWIQCCIELHPSDEGDVTGNPHFHICDTRLVV